MNGFDHHAAAVGVCVQSTFQGKEIGATESDGEEEESPLERFGLEAVGDALDGYCKRSGCVERETGEKNAVLDNVSAHFALVNVLSDVLLHTMPILERTLL